MRTILVYLGVIGACIILILIESWGVKKYGYDEWMERRGYNMFLSKKKKKKKNS